MTTLLMSFGQHRRLGQNRRRGAKSFRILDLGLAMVGFGYSARRLLGMEASERAILASEPEAVIIGLANAAGPLAQKNSDPVSE